MPRLADWVFLTLLDDYGEVPRDRRTGTATAGRRTCRSSRALHALHLPARLPEPAEHGRLPAGAARRPDAGRASSEVFADPGAAGAPSSGSAARSVLTVPMVARRRTLGAMALVRSSDDRRVHARTTSTSPRDLAGRAALAIDNVRLYQREHTVADTLQRSLLPDLPEVPGIESAAHYVSASTAADVGGDFYDLLRAARRLGRHRGRRRGRARRRRRRGHGPPARCAAGRASGTPRTPTPGAVLARVDRLVQGLRVASLATMVYARADAAGRRRRAVAGARRQRRAPAAAAAPARRRASQLLDEVTGLLVGVDAATHRETADPRRAPPARR